MEGYEIREFRPGDETSLLETFNLVFGQDNPDFQPRTRAEWDWAFKHNPAGFRIWVALHGEQIVAEYAALPVRMWVMAGEHPFAQIVDSMVHPDHRAGLKRPGLFVQTAWPFFDHYGGPDRDLMHFGWPIEKAWRIGETYLEYDMVRILNVLAREPGEGPRELPEGVERIERFDHQAKWLYDRCCGAWGASAIRDDAYLNWRLFDNPFHAYEAYGVRDGEGVLRGYAVYRHGDWIRPNVGIVVDWLVPPDEPEVGELLHEALLARGRADGVVGMAATFPEWSPWFERFQDLGWLVHPSDYFTVGRSFHRKIDMLWLRQHWWYQLIDTDLV